MKWPKRQKPCQHRSQSTQRNRAIPSATDNSHGVSEPRHLFAQGLRKLRPSLDLARHASARGLAGLTSFPTAPLHCREPLRGRYRFVPTVKNWRDRMEPAAPKVAGCKDLAASRLAAANPSCVGVRLMCNSREREAAQNKNGRVTSSGQDQQYGARRCLSPRTKN